MLIGSLLTVGALLGVGIAWLVKREAKSQVEWPQAEGTITSIECNWMTRYHVAIDYVFTFEGRRYGGNIISSPDGSLNLPGMSRRVLMKYSKGAKVTVFVNRLNPEHSVLEPGGHQYFLPTAMVFALIAFLVGARIVYLNL